MKVGSLAISSSYEDIYPLVIDPLKAVNKSTGYQSWDNDLAGEGLDGMIEGNESVGQDLTRFGGIRHERI
ncbi:hypothetical protein [Paenibacillus pinihumi]|uniref:hypothetical protein n=1 Tax=Paenibacillus pinihumi TaxID=669462 RepID=UPI00048C4250|nr:hypothetical protein [Paenibacillus pinihumi]